MEPAWMRAHYWCCLAFLLAVLAVRPSAGAVGVATAVVNTTADSGVGSLRNAFATVNTGGNIIFAIPGSPPFNIQLSTTIAFGKNVTIDGYTQTGATANTQTTATQFDASILVTVSYSSTILNITAGQVTIKGLSFVGANADAALILIGNGAKATIQGCSFTGNSTTGGAVRGQAIVGGVNAADRNVFFGLFNYMLYLSSNSKAINNLIGVSANGNTLASPVTNSYGISMNTNTANITIDQNAIVAPRGINAQGSYFVISNNLIGYTRSSGGTLSSASMQTGITLAGTTGKSIIANNTIGNGDLGIDACTTDNVISGNVIKDNDVGIRLKQSGNTVDDCRVTDCEVGIEFEAPGNVRNSFICDNVVGIDLVESAHTSNITNNVISNNEMGLHTAQSTRPSFLTIQGNYIGTDETGTSALGNSEYGIKMENVGDHVRIKENVISGNGYGISITTDDLCSRYGIEIVENIIGLNAAGTAALANSGGGIEVNVEALISCNVISGNGGNGISLLSRWRYTSPSKRGDPPAWEICESPPPYYAEPLPFDEIDEDGFIEDDYYFGSRVIGNTIGLSKNKATARGNAGDGIYVEVGRVLIGHPSHGGGNIIANSQGAGINFDGSEFESHFVLNNLIGTNGTTDFANGDGITVSNTKNVVIGLDIPDGRNIISGNTNDGISVINSRHVFIINNDIGVIRRRYQSEINMGNGMCGILVDNGDFASVGNYTPYFDPIGELLADGDYNDGVHIVRNAIMGNDDGGIQLYSGTEHYVAENYIGGGFECGKRGNDADDLCGFDGNSPEGIWVGQITDSIIQENVIYKNEGEGGIVFSSNFSSSSVQVLKNSIVDNEGAGIIGETSNVTICENVIGGSDYGVLLGIDDGGRFIKNKVGQCSHSRCPNSYAGVALRGYDMVINENVIVDSGGGWSQSLTEVVSTYGGGLFVIGNNTEIKKNYLGIQEDNTIRANRHGLVLGCENDNLVIEENRISGNERHGVFVPDGLDFLRLTKNYIGVNKAGSAKKPNQGTGVRADDVDRLELIQNLISGNDGDGVRVRQGGSVILKSNIIGLSANQNTRLANGGDGVQIEFDDEVEISFNTISGNSGTGVKLRSFNPTKRGESIDPEYPYARFEVNAIGVNNKGFAVFGNGRHGVHAEDVNVIMGAQGGLGKRNENPFDGYNIIGGNDKDGVRIEGGDGHQFVYNWFGAFNTTSGNSDSGLQISDASDIKIISSFFAGNKDGITLYGCENVEIFNITVGHTGVSAVANRRDGLQVKDVTNITVSYSTFVKSGRDHIHMEDGDGEQYIYDLELGTDCQTPSQYGAGRYGVFAEDTDDLEIEAVSIIYAQRGVHLKNCNDFIFNNELRKREDERSCKRGGCTYPLSDLNVGVYIDGCVGGTVTGLDFTLNVSKPIVIVGSSSSDNEITSNSYPYNAVDPLIDLGNDGVTPNTATYPRTGPNRLQQWPELNITSGEGKIIGAPSTSHLVEVYSFTLPGCAGDQFTLVDDYNVTTDANGEGTFTGPSIADLSDRDEQRMLALSVTNLDTGDTSELVKKLLVYPSASPTPSPSPTTTPSGTPSPTALPVPAVFTIARNNSLVVDVNSNGRANTNDRVLMTYVITNKFSTERVTIKIGPLNSTLTQDLGATATTSRGTLTVGTETTDTWITVEVAPRVAGNTATVIRFFVTGSTSANGGIFCNSFDMMYPKVSVSAPNGDAFANVSRAGSMFPVCPFNSANDLDPAAAAACRSTLSATRKARLGQSDKDFRYPQFLNEMSYSSSGYVFVNNTRAWVGSQETFIKNYITTNNLYPSSITCPSVTLSYVVSPNITRCETFLALYNTQLTSGQTTIAGLAVYGQIPGFNAGTPQVARYFGWWTAILASVTQGSCP